MIQTFTELATRKCRLDRSPQLSKGLGEAELRAQRAQSFPHHDDRSRITSAEYQSQSRASTWIIRQLAASKHAFALTARRTGAPPKGGRGRRATLQLSPQRARRTRPIGAKIFSHQWRAFEILRMTIKIIIFSTLTTVKPVQQINEPVFISVVKDDPAPFRERHSVCSL